MKVTCRECKQEFDVPVTEEQMRRWESGELIQKAMPNLSVDERELLISQNCGKCFDALFADEE